MGNIRSAIFAAVILGVPIAATADIADGRFPTPKYVSGIQETVSGCTAFHIGYGWWITAAHCVEPLSDARMVDIELYDTADSVLKQAPVKTLPARIAYYASQTLQLDDFAVLKTDLPKGYDIGELEIVCRAPSVGTLIHMTGFPGVGTNSGGSIEWGKMTHWGHVASEVLDHPAGWLHSQWTDLSVHGGFSGSAIQRDSDNKVVGVAVGNLTANTAMSFIIPMAKICAVLEITDATVGS